MKTYSSFLLICLLIFGEIVFAQPVEYQYRIPLADAMSVCAWPVVSMYDSPGRNTQRIGSIYYGENVERIGDLAIVRAENRTYAKVQTKDGRVGWVDDFAFVEDGGLVVVLEKTRIFRRPNAVTTGTDTHFEPGELVIFSNWEGDWVELVGKEKLKSGWIRGTHLVSVKEEDVKVAAEIQEALAETNPDRLRTRLQLIGQMRNNISPEMQSVLDDQIDATYYGSVAGGGTYPTGGGGYTEVPVNPDPGISPVPEDQKNYSVVVQEVIDMDTGRSYQRVTETGSVYEVLGPKKPKNIYWAYHKTRPIGSKILLHIPGNGGFVQVEIVNRLRQDNPNVVGLGKDLLMAVLGTRYPEQVVISYPK